MQYYAKSKSALKSALSNVGAPEKFFPCARDALRYALSANSQNDAMSLSLNDALEQAEKLGLDYDGIASIKAVFDGADSIEFGGAGATHSDCGKLSKDLSAIIGRILK